MGFALREEIVGYFDLGGVGSLRVDGRECLEDVVAVECRVGLHHVMYKVLQL